ncbi:hypothetical protein RR42_s3027 [Cupriavidus basilensis]|uniref:Uncharacterized protein n=1 Tax=Cupriavidus basilensis TaxID=68895 RepID=A0A0C4YNK5_9BURK|nr:hypothetical protein RR42_s3027 [Cupriavidus basilensis]
MPVATCAMAGTRTEQRAGPMLTYLVLLLLLLLLLILLFLILLPSLTPWRSRLMTLA